MKLKYVISFGTISLLSLISVFFSHQTGAEELNQDFKIETLAGDFSLIEALEMSALIRKGTHNFAKVTLTAEGAKIEPTLYDERHGLNEQQLKNRELYRDTLWVSTLETENYLITHSFKDEYYWNSRFDPTARIAVLDQESGNVAVLNHVFSDITRQMQIPSRQTFLIENNEDFYYVLTTYHNEYLVYSFDPKTLTLLLQFNGTLSSNHDAWYDWFSSDEAVFAISETGELYVINFETQNMEETNFAIDFNHWSSWFYEDHIIFENTEVELEKSNDIEDDEDLKTAPLFSVYDKNTSEITHLETPSFVEEFADQRPWAHVVGDYFVLSYQVNTLNPQTQFMAIYDLKSLELVYEGSIKLRRDQGLLEEWETIQGFTVSLREN